MLRVNHYVVHVIPYDIQYQFLKKQPFELLLANLFVLNSLGFIHLGPLVRKKLDRALPHKLFTSGNKICFHSCFGSKDFNYLLLALLYL